MPSPLPLPLTPTAAALDVLRSTLTGFGPPPYIGVTWRAGIAPDDEPGARWSLYKHIGLAQLAGILREVRGTIVVLQRRLRAGELQAFARDLGREAHDLSALNDDLEGMLVLLALLDDYVGVSNTNMHLRAGLGKRARVLVPCPAHWRWMTSDGKSPWFPGFWLYRQRTDGSWDEAFAQLRADLVAAHGTIR